MLEALSAHLKTMTDAQLAVLSLDALREMLACGEPLRYDPTQSRLAIDYGMDDDQGCVYEVVWLKVLDMAQSELETRRAIVK